MNVSKVRHKVFFCLLFSPNLTQTHILVCDIQLTPKGEKFRDNITNFDGLPYFLKHSPLYLECPGKKYPGKNQALTIKIDKSGRMRCCSFQMFPPAPGWFFRNAYFMPILTGKLSLSLVDGDRIFHQQIKVRHPDYDQLTNLVNLPPICIVG